MVVGIPGFGAEEQTKKMVDGEDVLHLPFPMPRGVSAHCFKPNSCRGRRIHMGILYRVVLGRRHTARLE